MDLIDILLSSLSFLTIREKILLRNNLDSLDKHDVLSIEEIAQIIKRPLSRCHWNYRESLLLAQKSASIMEKQSIKAVRHDSVEFPALLREIADPPYMIYYRGSINALHGNCVSVVGTRRACQESARAAFAFSKDAAESGVCVVSGLASGIDGFAHSGALASGRDGCTAAVLPCGVDSVVPAGHKTLAKRILMAGGCILSEYIPGTPAEPWRFVQRNRLIAALSNATVVVHAPEGSGALITADFALDYNRELVFHSAGFCKEADLKCRRVKKDGVGTRRRRASDYLEEGAALICDFDDFAAVQKDAPGLHVNIKTKQLKLFD